MPYQDIATFPKRLTIVTGLFVVGGMAFGLALSYYKNILFDQQLAIMQARNDTLKKSIDDGHSELEYYNAPQYKDKYAKENMGLVNDGEKVVIIMKNPTPLPLRNSQDLSEDEKRALFEENLRNIPVIDHWKLYLFHPDKLNALKK